LVLTLLFFLWQSSFQLTKIEIQGLSRLRQDAVLTTVGLRTGMTAAKADLDGACQKLIATGLFEGCNWKYTPTSRTGGTVTLDLKEAPAGQTVRLTAPGADEKQVWVWLSENEPLVQPKMPSSDDAVQFYTRAIQRYLKQDVTASADTNLETHETTLVFRPSNLAPIDSVRFEGTQALDASTLEKKFTPIAKGTAFTEYDVKHLLDLNIRPLYEDAGRLNVRFPEVKAQGGAVTVRVDEGPVYKLGQVKATGIDVQPQLPVGEVANWRKIVDSLDALGKNLRNQGYLEAKYKVNRELKDNGTVDVQADYTRGKQFVFGKLKLAGLTPTQDSIVRPLWTLAPGAPMNEGYVEDFIKAAFGKLGPEFNGVGSQIEPGPGNAVDVAVTFRTR
jgi:outer membrane protein insertion porin family